MYRIKRYFAIIVLANKTKYTYIHTHLPCSEILLKSSTEFRGGAEIEDSGSNGKHVGLIGGVSSPDDSS